MKLIPLDLNDPTERDFGVGRSVCATGSGSKNEKWGQACSLVTGPCHFRRCVAVASKWNSMLPVPYGKYEQSPKKPPLEEPCKSPMKTPKSIHAHHLLFPSRSSPCGPALRSPITQRFGGVMVYSMPKVVALQYTSRFCSVVSWHHKVCIEKQSWSNCGWPWQPFCFSPLRKLVGYSKISFAFTK